MSDSKIEQITKRFYKTEEERLDKIEKDKAFIEFFIKKMYSFIMALYNDGIKLHVFHHGGNIIHAGLFSCCSHTGLDKITKEKRLEVEKHLYDIGFTEVIWEDIID